MRRGPVPRGRHRRARGPAPALRALVGAALAALLLSGWGTSQAVVTKTAPQAVLPSVPPASPPAVVAAEPAPAARPPNDALHEGTGSPPQHITYAAVGMDQAVLPLSPTEQESSLGSIVPPHTADAYWLAPYGVPGAGSTNTTYIVGHSWEGRASPFNNISSQSKPGDQLTLTTAEGPLRYKIDQITTEYKDTLKDSAIWDKVPGRLILITCFAEDLWGKNIIVQAGPLPAE